MKYDKTTIIGVAACLVLLVSWPYVARRTGLVQPAPPVQEPPPADASGRPEPEPPADT